MGAGVRTTQSVWECVEWEVFDVRQRTLCRHVECGEVGVGLGSRVGLGSEQLTHGIRSLVAWREVGQPAREHQAGDAVL